MIEDPERVVLESGRPVLLIPNSGIVSMPPQRVTVAWNGRREATRAVFDAIPLLRLAQSVDIVWVDPEEEGDIPAAEISVALARHGITCQASKAESVGGDAGEALLRQTKAFGADLLVMGCYGHSRLREFVLGGASRYVLRHMSLPILMSH
jgi:nucleotide-binding universal stress UspA family protein